MANEMTISVMVDGIEINTDIKGALYVAANTLKESETMRANGCPLIATVLARRAASYAIQAMGLAKATHAPDLEAWAVATKHWAMSMVVPTM